MRPAEAQLAEYGLSAAQLAALEEGETVVVKLEPPNNAGVRVQAFRKMPVAPQSLRPVFTDCDRFVDFMPRTLKSKMTERTSNTSVCEMVVDMPFPFDDLWSVVRVKWGTVRPGVWSRSWTLVRGSFNRNEGSWTIHDANRPNAAYAVYAASVDPKVSIPDFILRAAQINTIPDLMMAVINRAKFVAQQTQ